MAPAGQKPGGGSRPGKIFPAHHHSPPGMNWLCRKLNRDRTCCGPMSPGAQTEAFKTMATYGTDQPGTLPRGCRARRQSRRKPRRNRFNHKSGGLIPGSGCVRVAIGVKIAADTKAT